MKKAVTFSIAVALSSCLGASAAFAQMVEKAEKRVLTIAGAKAVAAAVAAEAKKNNVGGAIAVVDDGGNLLYLERLDGTFPAASAVATDKARTAATFRRPTRVFEEAVKNGRISIVGVREITLFQGGVPLVFDGQVIGAVGVSGAASAQQDDDFATLAAAVIK